MVKDLYNNSDIPVSVQSLTELLRLPRPMPQGAPVYVTDEEAYFGQVYEPVPPGVTAYESLSNPHTWWVLLFALGGAGLNVVETIVALRAVPDTVATNGSLWYVRNVHAGHYEGPGMLYECKPRIGYPEEPLDYVRSNGGTWMYVRRWINPWPIQSEFYIAPFVLGDDVHFGDEAFPLKTGKEASARIAARRYTGLTIHVWIRESLPQGDWLDIRGIPNGVSVIITGSWNAGMGATQLHTGAFLGRTVQDRTQPGGGQRGVVGPEVIWGAEWISTDASPNVRLRASMGENPYLVAWPQVALGEAGDDVSQWVTPPLDFNNPVSCWNNTECAPDNTSPYVLERLATIPQITIEFDQPASQNVVMFDSLSFVGTRLKLNSARAVFWGCCGLGSNFESLLPGREGDICEFVCCHIGSSPNSVVESRGIAYVSGCHLTNPIASRSGQVIFANDTIAQDCPLTEILGYKQEQGNQSGRFSVAGNHMGVAAFHQNEGRPGITVPWGGFSLGNNWLWGVVGWYQIDIMERSTLEWIPVGEGGDNLNMLGGVAELDYRIGGYVGARAFDETTGAYTQAYPTAFANLVDPAKLNYESHRVGQDAHIVQQVQAPPA